VVLPYIVTILNVTILYINSLRPSVCLTGVLGGGEGEADEAANDRCQSVTGLDQHGFRVQTVYTKHCSHSKGRNDGRIASLSHHTGGGYKNLPLPHYRKNRRLYRGACFRKISKTFGNQGLKCQNRGFGFSHVR